MNAYYQYILFNFDEIMALMYILKFNSAYMIVN